MSLVNALLNAGLAAWRRNAQGSAHALPAQTAAKVIPLRASDASVPPGPPQEVALASQGTSIRPVTTDRALQDDTQLEQFMQLDHFDAGRHAALQTRNHEALGPGIAQVLARYDNILSNMAGVLRARLDRAEQYLLDVGEQTSPVTLQKLHKVIEHTKRDIQDLQRQRELARDGQGWFSEVVGNYRAGFQRGLRECVDIDKLFD